MEFTVPFFFVLTVSDTNLAGVVGTCLFSQYFLAKGEDVHPYLPLSTTHLNVNFGSNFIASSYYS